MLNLGGFEDGEIELQSSFKENEEQQQKPDLFGSSTEEGVVKFLNGS